jgi:hypothetical protein
MPNQALEVNLPHNALLSDKGTHTLVENKSVNRHGETVPFLRRFGVPRTPGAFQDRVRDLGVTLLAIVIDRRRVAG